MHRFRRLPLVFILTAFAIAASGALGSPAPSTPGLPAQPPAEPRPQPPSPRPGPTVEGITEYTLANGLKILLFPDATKPKVTVNVTYFVGSRLEGYGETGMAHLLEHMLFKGTAKHKNVWGELQNHGAFFNGTTWVDRTNYFETIPASDENLKFALELEADRMVNSRIAKEDLASEFSVVRNEFELGENNPQRVLQERMFSSAYLWHNYGKSTIGSRSDIERVPIENLRAFYQKYYQPDNAMLVVAGKFDVQATLALIQSYFGSIPRPARALRPSYTVEPVQDGERNVTLRRAGDVQVAGVMYHGVAGADPDFVAEDAIVDILTDAPSGRLYKALVEKGLAASVSGSAYTWTEPGVVQFYARVRMGKPVEPVQKKMIALVEGLGQTTITDEEVERFKRKTLKEIELTMTDSQRIGVELSEWAAIGDWRMMFLSRDRVKQLTAEQVRKVANAYLKPNNRTAGLFLPGKQPDRSPLPVTVDVQALVKDYKGEQAMTTGEVFAATIDNIEKATHRSVLTSGMKVALLPKKTRGNAVKVALRLHVATEKDLIGKQEGVGMIPAMLLRGSRKHSYQQLKDEFDRLKAEVAPTPGLGFNITTTRDNLPAVLSLVAEVLKEPTFPKDEFATLKKETLARLEEQLQQPQALAFTALFQKIQPWPKDNVRYQPSPKERIERIQAVKLEDLVKFHRAFFGSSYGEVAVVGDFDEAAVRQTLDKELGHWRSPRPFQRITGRYLPGIASSAETIKTPDKPMAFVGVGHAMEVRDDDPDYPALSLGNFMLGGGAKSRLSDRLRQKDGLSYGAGSQILADPLDRVGQFFAFAICAAPNADKAMTAMMEELGRMLKGEVSAAELSEAKKSIRERFDNQLASDDFVVATLARELYLGRTLEFDRRLLERIQAVSVADVAQVLKKYVEPERLIRVVAGDLK